MCFEMFWSIKHCVVLISLFEPSPGLLCNIQIAGFDLCEFADISHGLFMCVVSEGLHTAKFLMTVDWNASSGVVRDAFLM